MREDQARQEVGTAAGLPGGWRAAPEPDGSLRVRHVPAWGAIGILLGLNLFWNGVVGVFVAIGVGALSESGYSGPTPGSAGFWLFMSPFILVGVLMLAALLWVLLVRRALLAGPGFLEMETRIAGLPWRRRVTDGALRVERRGQKPSWPVLSVEAEGGQWTLATGPGIAALGQLLAERTQWPLLLP